MNVLFVLYHDFTSNSASHVQNLANELAKLGADCAVCVPSNVASLDVLGGDKKFQALLYEDVLAGKLRFVPDVTHAWTPREVVRRFLASAKLPGKLVVHLEDNEQHLLARALDRKWKDLIHEPLETLDRVVPAHLAHPLRFPELMRQADAATVIVDKLRELASPEKPVEEVWCSADESLFQPVPVNYEMRRELGIGDDRKVIVYPGNVHASNASEVRSLYTAVAVLNREGAPVTLVRAGRDFAEYLEQGGSWVQPFVKDLGMVEHKRMPQVLAMADLFVQPGKPGEFNDYRFPSKMPEFLALGRPVVLPKSNIALEMRHGVDAYVVPEANAMHITTAVLEILRDRDLAARLAAGSRRFFEERLSWKQGARKLEKLYASLLSN